MQQEIEKGEPPKDGRKFKYQMQSGEWVTAYWDGLAFSTYGERPWGGRMEGKHKDWRELPGVNAES